MNEYNDDGADGWVSHETAQRQKPQPEFHEHPHNPLMVVNQTNPLQEEVDKGKALAILSHASLFFGLPLFLMPMLTRDNRFALHHGKAAAVTYIYFMLSFVLMLATCGLTFPLIFLAYIPAIVGIVQAANGQLAGTWGFGTLGEKLFGSLDVKPKLGSEP